MLMTTMGMTVRVNVAVDWIVHAEIDVKGPLLLSEIRSTERLLEIDVPITSIQNLIIPEEFD